MQLRPNATPDVLERGLADVEPALDAGEARAQEAELRLASATAAAAAQARDLRAALSAARQELESTTVHLDALANHGTELEEQIREAGATRVALEKDIADARAALEDAQQRHDVALTTAAGELAERDAHFECERARSEAERAGLTAQLREVEEARDRVRREHQSAVAEHTAILATRENDIEQLRHSLQARVEELEVTQRRCDVLQAEAEQLPGVHHALQQSRAENRRMFQQAPLPMFRCTKDGMLTEANRALMILVGRRSADELRGGDLAGATFESPKDLSWLIERCLGSRGKESTETTWRRKDGSRLLVRLSACAISSELIECGVEDLTPVRVLNDRLSQAHRMEAVGRLATEVAVTCGSLLGGVHQNAQQWLMSDGSHPASRQHVEMLLDEISRAAGLLRQLAAYGDEESRKPAVVELRTVVRDVAPVLKRVAGDAVEVQLPAACAPLNVDAGAERVKRLLVNLAAYGRERMPFGGRLKIELGTTVADRHFVAKHPNVRLGPHALVTVTESRRATRAAGPLQLHDDESGSSSGGVAVQAGVDLGALQELVVECGGHLWMTVEPVGDMVVKIRLPLVTSYGEPARRPLVPGAGGGTLGRWFQH